MEVRWLVSALLVCACDPSVPVPGAETSGGSESTGGATSFTTSATAGPEAVSSTGPAGVSTGVDEPTTGVTDATTSTTPPPESTGTTGEPAGSTGYSSSTDGSSSTGVASSSTGGASSTGSDTGTTGDVDGPALFVPPGAVDPTGCTSWERVLPPGPFATTLVAGSHGLIFAAGQSGDQAWVIGLDEVGAVLGEATLDPMAGVPPGSEVVVDVGTSNDGRAFVLVEREGSERVASLDVETGSILWDEEVDDSWLTPASDWIGIGDMRQLAVTPSGRVMVMGRADAVDTSKTIPPLHTTNFVLFSVDESSGAVLWMERIPALDSYQSSTAGVTTELAASDGRGAYASRRNYVGVGTIVPTIGRYALDVPGPASQSYTVPPFAPPANFYQYNYKALAVGEGAGASTVMAWREFSPAPESSLLIRRYSPGPGGADVLDVEYSETIPQYELPLFAAVVTGTGDAHVFARDGLTRSLAVDGTMTSFVYPIDPSEVLRGAVMMRGDPEALVLLLETPAGFEVHQVCTLPSF